MMAESGPTNSTLFSPPCKGGVARFRARVVRNRTTNPPWRDVFGESMRHRIDHKVQTHAVGLTGILFRIARSIHVFPGISQVRVVCGYDHETASVVRKCVDARIGFVRHLPGRSLIAAATKSGTWISESTSKKVCNISLVK